MTNKEAIVWLKECKEHYGEYHEMCDEALDIAIKALDVKTAYWIRQETPYGYANSYECSECGRVIWNDEGEEGLEDFPYCHCGCRMIDKKETEE